MATIFEMNVPVLNIPLYYLLIPIVIIVIIYLIITRKPRGKEYKPINMKDEIKKEIKVQYKYFASPVHKPVYSGLIKIGYALGYMPLIWNKRLKIIENIKAQKKKVQDEYKEYIEGNAPAGNEYMVSDEPIGTVSKVEEGQPKVVKKGLTIEKTVDEPIPMFCFKVCGDGFFSKFLAQFLGTGTKYFLIEESDVKVNEQSIQFDQGLQRQFFFGNFIFSKAGKNVIDNTSFRIDRENQLQEIANQIPRTVFFDMEMSKRAMAMREVAQIEKEKFSAQKEAQQD